MNRTTFAAIAATAGLLTCTSTAAASQVSIDAATGGTTFTAGPGEANRLSIAYTTINHDEDFGTEEIDVVEFTDYGSTMAITDAERCFVGFDGNVVWCRYTPGQFPAGAISLGDGNDEIRQNTTGRPDTISGGPGDDILLGGAGADDIDGGPGDDALREDHGCSDTRDNGVGADRLAGGDGVDTLDLSCRADAISITLNETADDGAAGEGDNVGGDVEVFDAGSGYTRFAGNDLPQVFKGGGGGNEADGGGGQDKIYGGVQDDVLTGGDGNDTVEGYGGADRVTGGPGEDDLSGEGGSTITDGTGGADVILARDGFRDTVSCGTRADQAQVDQLDIVAESSGSDTCEVVDREKAVVSPDGPEVPGGTAPSVGLNGSSAKVRRNRFRLSLTCTGAEDCFGAAAVRTASRVAVKRRGAKRKRNVAAGLVDVAAGQTETLSVKLNRTGRRLLKTRKRLKVRVTLALTNAGATPTTATITLRK